RPLKKSGKSGESVSVTISIRSCIAGSGTVGSSDAAVGSEAGLAAGVGLACGSGAWPKVEVANTKEANSRATYNPRGTAWRMKISNEKLFGITGIAVFCSFTRKDRGQAARTLKLRGRVLLKVVGKSN